MGRSHWCPFPLRFLPTLQLSVQESGLALADKGREKGTLFLFPTLISIVHPTCFH